MKKQNAEILETFKRNPAQELDDKQPISKMIYRYGASNSGAMHICVPLLTVVPEFPPYMKRTSGMRFSS